MQRFLPLLAGLLLGFQAWAQCGDTTHTTLTADSWASCQPAPNPNSARGTSHWIRYDFGHVYSLRQLFGWNANESGETDRGFRGVTIDYSLDGQQWRELGSFEFPEATGYNSYSGFAGPDFGGVQARYVLLTAQSNWGDPQCYGLGELRFGLDGVTANDLEAQPSELLLYPNPVTTELRIDWGNLRPQQLRIVDLQGRIVQQHEDKIPNKLDVATLPTGIYFLSLQDEAGDYHSRGFMKE